MPLTRAFAVLVVVSGGLAAQSFSATVAGSGYQAPPAIPAAPGQIATFFVGGLPQTSAGLANVVAVINVSGQDQQVQVLSARVLDTETLAITVQFPFTGLPATAPQFPIQFAETDDPGGNLCAEGACTAPASLQPAFAQPHWITGCDLFVANGAANGNCPYAVLHQWAVGLGTPAQFYAVDSSPGGVCPYVADFNGDGKPDIVCAASGLAFFFLGTGNGTFIAQAPLQVGPNGDIAFGDFYGHGAQDLQTSFGSGTGVTSGVILILENQTAK